MNVTLQHRVFLASLTGIRAVPGKLHIDDVEPSPQSWNGMAIDY